MKLIVGLGNPDKEYINTRHNVGFIVLDEYLQESNWSIKFDALYCEKHVGNEKVLLIKPQTYMNNSGYSVKKFVDYFNIDLKDILVIQDDLDLPLGSYKLKKNSSSGGHNGIKSIISHLHSDEFLRLKVGISHSVDGNTVNHVLGKLTKREREQISGLQKKFEEIIECFVINGALKTINDYNNKNRME